MRLVRFVVLSLVDAGIKQMIYSDLCPEDACRMEIKTYNDYKNNGWTMLNEEKELGVLGGHVRRWSLEKIKTLISMSNIEYMLDFMKMYPAAYQSARANRWLDKLNLKYINKPNGYWKNPELIKELASQFDKWVDFENTYPQAAKYARKQGLELNLEKKEIHEKGYWTDERIISEAKMCTTLKEFRIEHKKAYDYSLQRGLFESFTWLKRAFDYLDLETVTKLAEQCNSWTELRKLNQHYDMIKGDERIVGFVAASTLRKSTLGVGAAVPQFAMVACRHKGVTLPALSSE